MVAAVRRLLVDGYPTIDRTAHNTGLSVRTLQRRLSEAGIGYREVVQTCRFEQACRLLAKTTLGVSEIASELGYADPSSFSRFFLRLSGTSPRAYRARARKAPRGDREGGTRGD
jgi:AraC-like DNA-binding protein